MRIPLVLLSGLLSNEFLWSHQKCYLKDVAKVKIINSFQNTPQKMIEFILDNSPDKFALAGHSMGGWLCLEIMRNSPERVSRLCLLNTTARSDSKEKKVKREKMIEKAKNGFFQEVIKEISENFVYNFSVKDKIEKMFLSVGKDVFIAQQKSLLMRKESQFVLPKISCPTLVVHAAKDRVFFLEEHKELVNQMQSAKLAIVEDSGHMSPIEMPQAVTSLMRFWLTYF